MIQQLTWHQNHKLFNSKKRFISTLVTDKEDVF